mmetsp:Transcript_48474/g.128000  ORF Transcript_48474/g.128000 Transcript_48474/m.128000 type:complete len:215 (-) Transcript_48474:119-763(-)
MGAPMIGAARSGATSTRANARSLSCRRRAATSRTPPTGAARSTTPTQPARKRTPSPNCTTTTPASTSATTTLASSRRGAPGTGRSAAARRSWTTATRWARRPLWGAPVADASASRIRRDPLWSGPSTSATLRTEGPSARLGTTTRSRTARATTSRSGARSNGASWTPATAPWTSRPRCPSSRQASRGRRGRSTTRMRRAAVLTATPPRRTRTRA